MVVYKAICIGAGPAGLTAAYLLSKKGHSVAVIEADPTYVGGISRTVRYKGFHFDIGGHRFFSKSAEVENLWSELLPDDMLVRPRLSRIYYRGKFFAYPLKAFDALYKLGIPEATACVLSYLRARLFPVKDPRNFRDWVSNQFGSRLFRIFFKSYTEKVWGMPCEEISADWAAQRIQGLSLGKAIWNALRPQWQSGDRNAVIKTLINSFRYPRKGPGMLWEAAARKTQEQGGVVHMGSNVNRLHRDATTRLWSVTFKNAQGEETTLQAEHVISTAPIRELMRSIVPTPQSVTAAEKLKYRDFITVAIIMKERKPLLDNWIYIHDPTVKVGRVQNFKSWSPELVPDAALSCLGLEYFCFDHDSLWNTPDADLVDMAKRELAQLGLARADDIVDGTVVRQPKAYPVYDDEYTQHVDTVRADLQAHYPGLHLVGRNGMHKYNNQDHAMMTAMLTVENITQTQHVYDVWQVNQDAEYHEAGEAASSGLRLVPKRVSES